MALLPANHPESNEVEWQDLQQSSHQKRLLDYSHVSMFACWQASMSAIQLTRLQSRKPSGQQVMLKTV
ncbi:hypothetical protein Fuma_04141 [Fuerstiella marisgermanici]|uniref:Uncharacterized protein n=1 Tax=Fuerstiella marisgermanici TaxID=1891926 RepID=A0A1P8WKC3_9PLAN|nr:hypothetical protein Fuma_04141 [Fuerstiella marisgermanici]